MYAVPPYSVQTSSSRFVSTGDPIQALAQFAQSTYLGVWPHLDKAQLLQELECRIRTPSSLVNDQMLMREQNTLSGGSAVLFSLIRKNPFRYVRLCHSLFETGGFQTLRQRIQASEYLKNSQVEQYWPHPSPWLSPALPSMPEDDTHPTISSVDWMLLMTLYEAQLSAFPPPAFMPLMPQVIVHHQQMTKPWELKGWLTDILGYRQVTFHHAHLHLGWHLLQRAAKVIAEGGVAIALVNLERLIRGLSINSGWNGSPQKRRPRSSAPLLPDSKPPHHHTTPLNRPDAWVTLTQISHSSPWNVLSQAPFRFTVHLGQDLIPIQVSRSAFRQNCWGIMLAKTLR